jgi:taurine--2-oxoglutarate transaminase
MFDYYFTWSQQKNIQPLSVQCAAEDYFVCDDGRIVYDFISTSFQASFGHSNKVIIDGIIRQTEQLSIVPPKSTFTLKERVTRQLIDFVNLGPGKIFYTVSGAEAVENAIKMARRISDKPIVLSRQRSYHGASLGAMSVSGDWRSWEHLNFAEGTRRIPEPEEDPDAEGAKRIVEMVGANRIAAIIVETISGTNGVIIPPASWLKGLRRICDENDILLIFDEVLVGFFRCGSPLAFHDLGGQPDMVCLSKALTGGYIPMGALWTSSRVAQFYEEHTLTGGLTSYAHPLGLAAVDSVMALIQQTEFHETRLALQDIFDQRVRQLASDFAATAVRCRGLLAAIEFGKTRLPSLNSFWKAGLHLYCRDQMMILAPPLISQPERLSQAFQQVDDLLRAQG